MAIETVVRNAGAVPVTTVDSTEGGRDHGGYVQVKPVEYAGRPLVDVVAFEPGRERSMVRVSLTELEEAVRRVRDWYTR